MDWWTVDSDGGDSQGGTFSQSGTISQPDAAQSHGGSFTLQGGFWPGAGKLLWNTYLPLTVKL